MFSSIRYSLIFVATLLNSFKTCTCDPPSLVVYSPGEPEYTDIVVKKQHEDLILVCEVREGTDPRLYVWNYIPDNSDNSSMEHRRITNYTIEPASIASISSKLVKRDLQLSDSGHYMCSTLPYSVSKRILVQARGPSQCARGAFWCGVRCVLASYVCDGYPDCMHGEDEHPALCSERPCARNDRLNCSSGRCIPEAACCRSAGPVCRQHHCCDEHPSFSTLQVGYAEVEYPPLYEDRHAPDEYGFIQSTIYTVTACALIFMIAVVLLVSAICKMHMKRAALRSYTHADNATRRHYSVHYAQSDRFPPCYEASRLLEEAAPHSPLHSPNLSPVRQPLQCNPACGEPTAEGERGSGFGLARLSAIFSSRYRQVPTQCLEVEMREVRSTPSSPVRSPTTGPASGDCDGLNIAALHLFRPRPSHLTLHLGRFQLSIPRFGRRQSEPRPDTPNVTELNIDDIDLVRLNSPDTYTLNGRTIRLLGGNYPLHPIQGTPPSYTEAVRYKLYGPPPEYLSRDVLNDNVDEEAASNIEMPPCYDDLGDNARCNDNVVSDINNATGNSSTGNASLSNATCSLSYGNSNINSAIASTSTGHVNSSTAAGSSINVVGSSNNGAVSSSNAAGNSSNAAGTASNAVSSSSNAVGSSSNAAGSSINAIDNACVAKGNLANAIDNNNPAGMNANGNLSKVVSVVNNSNETSCNASRNINKALGNFSKSVGNINTINSNTVGISNKSIASNNAAGNTSETNNTNGNSNKTSSINASSDVTSNNNSVASRDVPVSTNNNMTSDVIRNDSLREIIDNLPAIDSDVNANDVIA